MQATQPKKLSDGDAQLLRAWFAEELGLQEELADLLSVMERHMVKHDLGALERHLVSSAEVLNRMEHLEKKRSKILGHLIRAANLRAERGVLEELINLTPVSFQEDLHMQRKQLEEIGGDVRTRSNRNNLLARNSLDINDEIVRALFAVGTQTATYDRQGSKTRHSEMILNRSI